MKRSIQSRLSCTVAVTICVFFSAGLLFAVPRFTQIFEDFDTDLPLLTLFIIRIHNLLAGVFILFAVLLIVKEVALRERRKLTATINLSFLVLLGISLGMATMGLFLPFVKLMQAVE